MLPSNTAADAAYFRGKSPTLLERKRGNDNTLRGTVGQLWAVLGPLFLAIPIYTPRPLHRSMEGLRASMARSANEKRTGYQSPVLLMG